MSADDKRPGARGAGDRVQRADVSPERRLVGFAHANQPVPRRAVRGGRRASGSRHREEWTNPPSSRWPCWSWCSCCSWGSATFIRLVQVQRESMVYITGMNRIRHFFVEAAPASRPYFVLPVYDDAPALYRSIGTGMSLKRPRFELLHLTVQTQGIVGIVTAVVAAGCAGLAASPAGGAASWIAASLAFLITLVAALRLLAAVPGQHPGRHPSTPPHAERAAHCAVLIARVDRLGSAVESWPPRPRRIPTGRTVHIRASSLR